MKLKTTQTNSNKTKQGSKTNHNTLAPVQGPKPDYVRSTLPLPYALAFFGLSLGFKGAPGFSFALGNCDK